MIKGLKECRISNSVDEAKLMLALVKGTVPHSLDTSCSVQSPLVVDMRANDVVFSKMEKAEDMSDHIDGSIHELSTARNVVEQFSLA